MSIKNYDFYRLATFILFIILFLAGGYESSRGNVKGALLIFAAGLFCLLVSFPTIFSSVKAFGIEAKFNEKIAEADEVIKRLRELSMPLSEVAFSLIARSGWMKGPISKSDQARLRQEIRNNLAELGISEEDISVVEREWHLTNLSKMARPLTLNIRTACNEKIARIDQEIKSIRQPISGEDIEKVKLLMGMKKPMHDTVFLTKSVLNPSQIEGYSRELTALLDVPDCFDDSEKADILKSFHDVLEDIRFYEKELAFRRPSVWFSNNEWED